MLTSLNCQAHAAIKAKFAQLETGQVPDLSENEYNEPFLLYLAIMSALRKHELFGLLLDGFLEDLVLIGQSVFGHGTWQFLPDHCFLQAPGLHMAITATHDFKKAYLLC